jgi:hypothetical protein
MKTMTLLPALLVLPGAMFAAGPPELRVPPNPDLPSLGTLAAADFAGMIRSAYSVRIPQFDNGTHRTKLIVLDRDWITRFANSVGSALITPKDDVLLANSEPILFCDRQGSVIIGISVFTSTIRINNRDYRMDPRTSAELHALLSENFARAVAPSSPASAK